MAKNIEMQKENEHINDIIEYYKSGGTRKTYIGEELKKNVSPKERERINDIIEYYKSGGTKNKYIEEELLNNK